MGDIGVAIGPLLLAMLLHRVNIGLVQQGLIHIRLVCLNPLHEFVLSHHEWDAPKKKARQLTGTTPSDWRTMIHNPGSDYDDNQLLSATGKTPV
jgi:hypothetical protein